MIRVHQLFGTKAPKIGKGLKTDKLLLKNQLVGLEIEAEGVSYADLEAFHGEHGFPLGWDKIRDGSLRNGGIEFVMTEPVCGKTLVNRITRINNYLSKFEEFQGNPLMHNIRTSLHVHLNFSDKTKDQLFGFTVMYLIFERILAKYCGKKREENVFCVPVFKSFATYSQLEAFFIHGKFTAEERHKYGAINIHSLRKFQSLEIRLHPGTHNVSKILRWINILFCMVKAGEEYVDSGRLHRIPEIVSSEDMIPFGITVFSEYWKPLTLGISEEVLREIILKGVREAQDLVYFYPFAKENY